MDAALKCGPQEISVATKEPAVLLSRRDFEKLAPNGASAWDFVRDLPKNEKLAQIIQELEREEE